jgi:hypothetical protein
MEPSKPDLSGIRRPEHRREVAGRLDHVARRVSSSGGHRWLSSTMLWAGFLCVCAWVGFNLPIHGNSSSASTSSGSGSSSGSSAKSSLLPHRPTGAVIWNREVSMSDGAVYGLDTVPLQQNVQDGVGPATGGTFAGEALVISRSTTHSDVAVSAWHGIGAPSHGACVRRLATAATDYVQLEPPGITVGGWICARTVVGDIARLRLDGGDPTSGYRLHVTVWDH